MRWALAIVFLALALLKCCTSCSCTTDSERWRIATFNIEDFPKHEQQIAGAFDEIARLDAGIVAVQEIVEPELFRATARERLGAHWAFVAIDTLPASAHPTHHLGVLYDTRAFAHVRTRIHDGTRLDAGHKPTLDVELKSSAGTLVRVLVVHLKAGGENHPIRRRQYAALAKIADDVKRSGARVVLLGDFNATGDADRRDIAELARKTGLGWASERLGCSAFWDRDDDCQTSRLDHALTSTKPASIKSAGACAEGCQRRDTCPLYTQQVSDHCPVVLAF